MAKKKAKEELALEPISNCDQAGNATACDDLEKYRTILSVQDIEKLIVTLRGVQVLIDRDLAFLYQVEVKQMNRQVKRNIERFPEDFMFQLTIGEFEILTNQILKSQNSDAPASNFSGYSNMGANNNNIHPPMFNPNINYDGHFNQNQPNNINNNPFGQNNYNAPYNNNRGY